MNRFTKVKDVGTPGLGEENKVREREREREREGGREGEGKGERESMRTCHSITLLHAHRPMNTDSSACAHSDSVCRVIEVAMGGCGEGHQSSIVNLNINSHQREERNLGNKIIKMFHRLVFLKFNSQKRIM